LVLAGCSTGPYLKPYGPVGWYSTENPACPGAEKVLEFSLPNYDWLIFRILAKQPTKYQPEGTKLIAYVRPVHYRHPEPSGTWSLFPSEQERKLKENLISERKTQEIDISFSRSSAIVIFSDGSQTSVELPFFQQPYKLPSGKYYGIWGPEAVISSNKLEAFTVKLPFLFVNGEKVIIPPIEFKVSESKYAPVLNC
jgi:hypothetical protein